MTLLIPAKVLLHVWSYDFYDMTLSTGKQRRHMINSISIQVKIVMLHSIIAKCLLIMGPLVDWCTRVNAERIFKIHFIYPIV